MEDPTRLLIRGGSVVSGTRTCHADVLVQGQRIVGVLDPGESASFTGPATEVIDAHGKYLVPGLIDAHVHFRDPGLTTKETFGSGTRAAAIGGVTTVLDMPNTIPTVNTSSRLDHKVGIVEESAHVDFGLYAALDEQGAHRVPELAEAGAIALKLFLGPTTGGIRAPERPALVRALHDAAASDLVVAVHAEDEAIIQVAQERQELRNARSSYHTFLEGRPRSGELAATSEVVSLARHTRARMHVAHVALTEAVELLARAKADGISITGEACLPHLFLDDVACDRHGSVAKVLPPIRTSADRDALWSALRAGVLDCIGTDHAPHEQSLKVGTPFADAPGGIVGVELLLPMLLTAVRSERLTLEQLVTACCEGPADLFGLTGKGRIEVGADADLVVVDPSRDRVIDASQFESLARHSPFDGTPTFGTIDTTILRGKVVARDGVIAGPPLGQHVSRSSTST